MDDSEEAKVTAATNALAAVRDAVNRLPESYAGRAALERQFTTLQTSLNGKKTSRTNGLVADARSKINALMNDSEEMKVTEAEEALAKVKAAMATPSQITPLETSLASKRKARATHLVTLAQTAVGNVAKYNRDAAAAATAALDKAETAVDQLPAAERGTLPSSVTGLRTDLNTKKAAQMRNLVPALFRAMDGPDPAEDDALDNLGTVPYYITSLVDSGNDTPADGTKKGTRGDFRIDPAKGAGTIADENVHTAVWFGHGQHSKDAAEKVSKDADRKWTVTDYTRTTGSNNAQVTDRVHVYNDRQGGPLISYLIEKDLATYFATDGKPINAGTLTTANRQISLGTGVDRFIVSPEFQTVGGKTHVPKEGETAIRYKGTYMSAPGTYVCPTSPCSVGVGVGGYFLGANWYFEYDEGAKVKERDFDYQAFGWWVRENANGKPVAVSAFYLAEGGGNEFTTDGISLQGEATYEGPAIGQYAIHDPLNDKSDGGAFTATATLTAKFGALNLVPDMGLTGTIHNFKLKGGTEDPGWKVELQNGTWRSSDTATTGTGHINEAMTVWSINDVKAPKSGSWVASMYDEAPGEVADGGDGSNAPTSILGKFYSEYAGTHRMTGAFGTKVKEE